MNMTIVLGPQKQDCEWKESGAGGTCPTPAVGILISPSWFSHLCLQPTPGIPGYRPLPAAAFPHFCSSLGAWPVSPKAFPDVCCLFPSFHSSDLNFVS